MQSIKSEQCSRWPPIHKPPLIQYGLFPASHEWNRPQRAGNELADRGVRRGTFYSAAVRLRNSWFDWGLLRSTDLGRPTISVGNVTAGGTGKTPLVRWLAERLRAEGRHVVVLARGYKAKGAAHGDEQRMLDMLLNTDASQRVELIANPDRVSAAAHALRRDPTIDVFLLDDGFQHRRARRDLDLVLVSAPEPFGFGHVLPRGLLREPRAGLQRASACILTHCDQVAPTALELLKQDLRRHQPELPIYRAIHAHIALRGDGPVHTRPMDWLAQTPFFAFAGLGAPHRLDQQLRGWGASYRGSRWFTDHYDYQPRDVDDLRSAALAAGALAMLTTEKDWAKLQDLPGMNGSLPIWRIEMAMQLLEADEDLLWKQVSAAAGPPRE